MNNQIQKLQEKNAVSEKEVLAKKNKLSKLEQDLEVKRKKQIAIEEKVRLLKQLKCDFEKEISRLSNKSSNQDLFSTEDSSYNSQK